MIEAASGLYVLAFAKINTIVEVFGAFCYREYFPWRKFYKA
jgi:hypothetical protein